MPQACTLIRTEPGPGSGMGRSMSSRGPPGRETCTARMVGMRRLRKTGYSACPPGGLLPARVLAEELAHQPSDGIALGLQGEVAGVEQVVRERLQVALVRLGAGGREDLVVLPPGDQHRRLVLAEVLLPLRVQRRVATVAEEQVELDLVVARTVEQELVVGWSVGADEFRVPHPVRILPPGRLIFYEPAEGVALLLAGRLLPVRLDRLPEIVVQALLVRLAVLHHDGGDPLR